MNRQVFMYGLLMGFFLAASLIGGFQLSGLTVAGGDRIELDLSMNRSGMVALTLPRELSSFSLDGVYAGSGSVTVDLVGPNGSWRIAEYAAPQNLGNASFLLEKGGTVVRLRESLVYERSFGRACEESCDANMSGPFMLRVALTGGNLTLRSLHYESPLWITTPIAPDNITNETIEEPEVNVTPAHENIPPECSTDDDCDGRCLVNYCISETGHLNITDKTGRLVALFDRNGRILLASDIHQETLEAPPINAFRIETPVGVAAWITDAGELFLRGYLHERVAEVPVIGSQNFIIRNPQRDAAAIQGHTGDLFTTDVVVSGALR